MRATIVVLATLADIIRIENYTWNRTAEFGPPWPFKGTGDISYYDHFGVNFKYQVVPAPGAVPLGVIGITCAARRLRRERA